MKGQPFIQGRQQEFEEKAKIDKYGDLATKVGMAFCPIVHESFRKAGEPARKTLKICAERIAANASHRPTFNVLFYGRPKTSFALQPLLARARQERHLNIQTPNSRCWEDECNH